MHPEAETIERLRADLATATSAAIGNAGTAGGLTEAVKVAGILCGVGFDDPERILSALVERARGGA